MMCAAIVFCGCTSDVEPPAPRHLVLVTLDTTRADRLGCYGKINAGTPTLDGLADEGTRFERVYAQTPLTLPSHVSIFTGLNPPHTGIHVNGQTALLPNVKTLTELLAENGFFSIAAVGGFPVAEQFPTSRGFERFDDRMVDPNNPSGLERDAGEVVAAALRQLDGALADLLLELRSRLDPEETLVCVVGDHGEGLGDHGEPTHGFFVYESTMLIPLIIAGPRVPQGDTRPQAVQSVDILPTLLKLLDLPVPTGLDGIAIDFEEGGSVVAHPIYIESELPYRHYGWSPLRGVIDGRLKYVDAPIPELYDLRKDPEESSNLAASMPQEVEELDALLARMIWEVPDVDGAAAVIDPRLSSLGYVGSGTTSGSGSDLADPKERLDTYLRFTSANRFLEDGLPEDALPLFEELVREEGSIGARLKRAQTWRMLGRFEEAKAELLRLEREDPSMAAVHFEIARIAIWTNRPALALEKLETYLERSPGDAEAVMFRGAAREMLGDMEGAEEDYRRALALNPAFHGASLRLGALLLITGRTAEARSHLTAHMKSFPGDDIARGLLESM
jgi:hypothetical protein